MWLEPPDPHPTAAEEAREARDWAMLGRGILIGLGVGLLAGVAAGAWLQVHVPGGLRL